jgi:uncharacterized protein YoaH (UPF0181 family)
MHACTDAMQVCGFDGEVVWELKPDMIFSAMLPAKEAEPISRQWGLLLRTNTICVQNEVGQVALSMGVDGVPHTIRFLDSLELAVMDRAGQLIWSIRKHLMSLRQLHKQQRELVERLSQLKASGTDTSESVAKVRRCAAWERLHAAGQVCCMQHVVR